MGAEILVVKFPEFNQQHDVLTGGYLAWQGGEPGSRQTSPQNSAAKRVTAADRLGGQGRRYLEEASCQTEFS